MIRYGIACYTVIINNITIKIRMLFLLSQKSNSIIEIYKIIK